MNILKVKTLICFQNQKEQWNVTNLAVTLGEEKYAVSRVLTVLEKEGLIDKSNRRKPILNEKGKDGGGSVQSESRTGYWTSAEYRGFAGGGEGKMP